MSSWTIADIPSQSGKLALVTGGTGGLGFETARALARAGAEVVLTGRNDAKGNEAVVKIRQQSASVKVADKGTITRQIGGKFYRAESYGFSQEFMNYVRTIPIEPERSSASGRALLEGRVVHIPDVEADPDYRFAEAQRLGVFRTILAVPMLREGVPIGVITLTRDEAKPFTDKQIELAVTFADQASIAIENVRLFEAVKARTDELA